MKLECVKTNLKDALLAAERFTGKQLALPVLRYVLFIAAESKLQLRATNLEIGIEIDLPARVKEEGVVAVAGDILGNFLSGLPQEKNISIEEVGEHLSISGDTHTTLVKKFPYEDFPTIPVVTKGIQITFDAKELINALKATHFAAALSDIKPEFASVYVYTSDQSIFFVATDSSRLAEKRILLKNTPEQCTLLIPAKNIAEIIRIFENKNGTIDMIVAKNQVSFHMDGIHVTSRLIGGNFPDYKQIIPKQTTTEATLLRQELIDRLKLTNIFSGKLQQVRFKIYPEEKIFEIESKSDEVGETTQQIDAVLKGEQTEYLFNQRYLLDVLTTLATDSIALLGSGKGKPLIIKGVGDQTFQYLIMPMRG